MTGSLGIQRLRRLQRGNCNAVEELFVMAGIDFVVWTQSSRFLCLLYQSISEHHLSKISFLSLTRYRNI